MTPISLRFDGAALKRARTERGLTQALLAGLAGVGELSVQRAEAGAHDPKGATVAAFGRILKVDVQTFYVEVPA